MTQKARLILCAAIPLYLAGDFFLFNGPLNRALQTLSPDSPAALAKAFSQGVVARVAGQPITSGQLDRAVAEKLRITGGSTASFSKEDEIAIRKEVLGELILHELLRHEMKASEQKIEVPAAEVDARLAALIAGFPDKEGFLAAMKSQGIASEAVMRQRLEARIREEKYVASRSGSSIGITDEEAKQWYDAHAKDLAFPERIEARHVFISTLETPAEEAKKKLDEALAQLTAKQKDFPTLAKELSQDPSSKDAGGNLGWLSRGRLSPDLAEPLFTLAEKQPTLVRTRLGWHLAEVTARKPSEPRSFDDSKAEILAALEAVKRGEAVETFKESLRKSSAEVRILDPELRG